jgi:hypothetical protein
LGKELIFVLVWIERLGRVGEDDLFGFGLQPDEVTGEILLDPFGRATLHKKNSAMTESRDGRRNPSVLFCLWRKN